MSLTIPTRLVKISVIEILTPISFCITFCSISLEQFIVLKDMLTRIIEQREKRAFNRMQVNQASVGWGDLDTA